jgi:hypothetical protein
MDSIAAALCVPVPFVLRHVTSHHQATLLLEVRAPLRACAHARNCRVCARRFRRPPALTPLAAPRFGARLLTCRSLRAVRGCSAWWTTSAPRRAKATRSRRRGSTRTRQRRRTRSSWRCARVRPGAPHAPLHVPHAARARARATGASAFSNGAPCSTLHTRARRAPRSQALPPLAAAVHACEAARAEVLRRLRELETSLRDAERELQFASAVNEAAATDLDASGCAPVAATRRAVAAVQATLAARLRTLCREGGDVEGLCPMQRFVDDLGLSALAASALPHAPRALEAARQPSSTPPAGAAPVASGAGARSPPSAVVSGAAQRRDDGDGGGSSSGIDDDEDDEDDDDAAGGGAAVAARVAAKRARSGDASAGAKRQRAEGQQQQAAGVDERVADPAGGAAMPEGTPVAPPAEPVPVASPLHAPHDAHGGSGGGGSGGDSGGAGALGALAAAWPPASDAAAALAMGSQRSVLGSVSPGRVAAAVAGLITPHVATGGSGGVHGSPGVGSGAGAVAGAIAGGGGAGGGSGGDAGGAHHAGGGGASVPVAAQLPPYLFSVAPSTAGLPHLHPGPSPSTLPLGQRALSFSSPAWAATGGAARAGGEDATQGGGAGGGAGAGTGAHGAHAALAAPVGAPAEHAHTGGLFTPRDGAGARAGGGALGGWGPHATPGSAGGCTGLGGPYGDGGDDGDDGASPRSASPWPALALPSQGVAAASAPPSPLGVQPAHESGSDDAAGGASGGSAGGTQPVETQLLVEQAPPPQADAEDAQAAQQPHGAAADAQNVPPPLALHLSAGSSGGQAAGCASGWTAAAERGTHSSGGDGSGSQPREVLC